MLWLAGLSYEVEGKNIYDGFCKNVIESSCSCGRRCLSFTNSTIGLSHRFQVIDTCRHDI